MSPSQVRASRMQNWSCKFTKFNELSKFIGRRISDHEQSSGSSRTEEELFSRYGSAFREWPRAALYGGGRGEFLRRMRGNVCCRRGERLRQDYAGAHAAAAHRAGCGRNPV